METIRNQYIAAQHVRLDGKHFVDCTLTDCTLEYGGGPVILERTHITGCNHVFCGAAERTLSYVDLMRLAGPALTDPFPLAALVQ